MLPKGRSVADSFSPQIVEGRTLIVDRHVQAVDEAGGSVQDLSLIAMNDAPDQSSIGESRMSSYRIGPLKSRNPTTASCR
jgi:hypothetical protein